MNGTDCVCVRAHVCLCIVGLETSLRPRTGSFYSFASPCPRDLDIETLVFGAWSSTSHWAARAYHVCRGFALHRTDLRETHRTYLCPSRLNWYRFASETPINFCYLLWNAWCFSKACKKELFGISSHWSIWFGSEFHTVASLLINHINLFMSPGQAVHF